MYNHQLDTLIQVAESGSFTKAAEALFVSPNAVMKQINRLEAHLGVTLFVRSNRGLALTEAGEVICQDAKYLIRHSRETLERARSVATRAARTIRVGSSLMRPGQAAMALWREVSGQCPGIQLQLVPFDDRREHYLELIAHLGEQIDVVCGIFPSNRFDNRCNVLELGRYALNCAMPVGHRLAGRTMLEVEDLYGEKLMMVHRGDTAYIDALRDELEKHHPQVEIVDVGGYDIRTMNQCERMGCLLLNAEPWQQLHPSLVTIPVNWEYTVPHGLIYARKPSEAVREFVAAICRVRGLAAAGISADAVDMGGDSAAIAGETGAV